MPGLIVIGMLVTDNTCYERIHGSRIVAYRQSVEGGEKAQPVTGIDLQNGCRDLRIVERADRDLQIAAIIVT